MDGNADGDLSFLALGDSYTIGESVDEADRWPVLLVDRLHQENINLSRPRIIATTGWTTDELIKAIDEELTDPGLDISYDLVSLLIGVNNQYRGYDIDTYRKEVRELMERAIQYSENRNSRVFVVSIPDWGVTPFAVKDNPETDKVVDRNIVAKEIDRFNSVKREEAEKLGIIYIDITEVSRTALNNPTLTAADGLHPTGEMYSLWVDLILPQVRQLLN
jgi:lysophospholipase L1-like esterase